MMAKRQFVFAIVLLLASVAGLHPALAERVFVRAASGDVGHAWLFGSLRQDAKTCWLAVPRHVVADSFTGELAPFTFETMDNGGGQSGMPIPVSAYPEALAAMEGVEDMAFAPVVAGPRPGQCLSRLGPPPFAYRSMIRSASELTMFSLLPGSYGIFPVEIAKARADDAGGGMLKLRSVRPGDTRSYLVKGLSGSVAEMQQPEGMVPVAMVLAISGKPLVADAVRFDLIRAAFAIIEAHAMEGPQKARATVAGVPYTIGNVEAMTVAGEAGPAALIAGNACWMAAPVGGRRAVRLTIALGDDVGATHGLSVVQAADCGSAGARVIIEQRPGPSVGWTTAGECSTVAASGETPACRLDLRGPREIRISIVAGGAIGLSQLRLY